MADAGGEPLAAVQEQSTDAVPAPSVSASAVPIAMSFPAALRNPGITRFLQQQLSDGPRNAPATAAASRKNRRVDKDGKRWIRRAENARFVGNPHIVQATRKDYVLPSPTARSTFPEPLPSYLSRNTAVPSATLPKTQPISANAGRFSLSLKGMRRELRGSGPRTEQLVREVETEIASWLHEVSVVHNPESASTALDGPGDPIGETGAIMEVSRTPLQLVWAIDTDAHARYVVHCTARFYEIVSFSKDHSGRRLTYLLRPNVTRPDPRARNALETPPPTDLSAHEFDTTTDYSDFVSEKSDALSDMGDGLSVISERSRASSPARSVASAAQPRSGVDFRTEDEWSVISENEGEGDANLADVDGSEHGDGGLADSVQSLFLNDDLDTNITPRVNLALRQRATFRSAGWDAHQGRTSPSPSRSPARRVVKRKPRRAKETKGYITGSFYNYLFA